MTLQARLERLFGALTFAVAEAKSLDREHSADLTRRDRDLLQVVESDLIDCRDAVAEVLERNV